MAAQDTQTPNLTPMRGRAFWLAFGLNAIWINVSGLPRYFLVVKPMLHEAFPDVANIAPVSIPVLLIWGAWTVVFVFASTCFYWICFDRYGASVRTVSIAAVSFTLATIGLTWIGIANMGLAPMILAYAAIPLALAEQLVSAWIVKRSMRKN